MAGWNSSAGVAKGWCGKVVTIPLVLQGGTDPLMWRKVGVENGRYMDGDHAIHPRLIINLPPQAHAGTALLV